MTYKVFEGPRFIGRTKKISGRNRMWLAGVIRKLENLPEGKTLKPNWLYQKRFREKRLIFIVDKKSVLIVDFCSKKEQQSVIDETCKFKNELISSLRSAVDSD